jgi:pSer/pThr/pTyr-binding forkhead associated (FHA) protein
MPYLRIFDVEKGSCEFELKAARVVIGRHVDADIVLNNVTVSRIHALLRKDTEGYVIEDANARAGTYVNHERVNKRLLKHGDTIQISVFVMEYRTDDLERLKELTGEDSAINRSLKMNFKKVPAALNIRYRLLSVKPRDIFFQGDTLEIGGGGMLVPVWEPLEEGACLELELGCQGGKPRSFMGEVIAVVTDHNKPAMCIKLHKMKTERYDEMMRWARRGSWVELSRIND